MPKALIDGDIVAYRCAAAYDNDDFGLARWQADELIKRILSDTGSDTYSIWLTGSDNFRYDVYPSYKANRVGKPRPRWWEPLKEHLVVNWNAKLTYGYEADDAIGMELIDGTICCSIDKDFRQIPGTHFNFVKQEIFTVSEAEAERYFWMQMLTGDVADNIQGVPGIGPVKAERILVAHYPEAVLAEYVHYFHDKAVSQYKLNGKLLRIWRSIQDKEWELALPEMVPL